MLSGAYRNLFQVAYVTTDLARALGVFRDGQGVADFLDLGQMSLRLVTGETAEVKVALGYVGNVMIEIVQPVGGAVDLYTRHLAADRFDLRLHHLGYLVDSAAELDALADEHRRNGNDIAVAGGFGTDARFFYADTQATLGHYQEYVYFDTDGLAFLKSIRAPDQ